ncbi:MAG: bacteriohemerythrin [Alphaproteobacteria bacterium]|nr:bacteriohemerythrin [Rhodospirillales bacterium]MCW9045683.1 bacteriohemerythrin [Alphaproteobacteria bacterium]
MALLEFRDDFNTGNSSIDHEHKELINLINELHESLQSKDTKNDVEDILGELHGQVSSHFALEEKVMRDMKYVEVNEHCADHNRLLGEILDIADAVHNDENYDYMPRLEREVQSWFVNHFKEMDARLHAVLKH